MGQSEGDAGIDADSAATNGRDAYEYGCCGSTFVGRSLTWSSSVETPIVTEEVDSSHAAALHGLVLRKAMLRADSAGLGFGKQAPFK